MNPEMKNVNVDRVAEQAVKYVLSNPCAICSCESFCGVKYKGTCKIRRKIRLGLCRLGSGGGNVKTS